MANNPLTDAALAELDRLFAAATPGEWQVSGSHIYGPDPKRSLIAQTLDWPTNSRDAIAALHNAYPALRQRLLDAESRLAEVERERDEAREAVGTLGRELVDALARIAALEAALRGLKSVLGPSAPTCDGCSEEIAEALVQVDTALSGSDSALKPLLVRAARAGCESAYEDASSYCQEDDDGRRKWAEAIAERVIRGE